MAYIVFFFFQAEDGIRDPLVTGVQTCALPIWTASRSAKASSAAGRRSCGVVGSPTAPSSRSEERRVGKECRSRWSRYHSKTKEEGDETRACRSDGQHLKARTLARER